MFSFLVCFAFHIPFFILSYFFGDWFLVVGLLLWVSPLPDFISVRYLEKKRGLKK